MRRLCLIPFAALALAAAPAGPVQTGKWEVTVHPTAIPIPPELDKESGPALRSIMTRPETTRVGLKRADLTLLKPLFASGGQKRCTPDALTLADGHLTGTATCVESNQPMQATVAGSYTSGNVDITLTRTEGGLDRPGTVAMTIAAKRLGH